MAAACSKLSRGSWHYPVILYQVILLINLLQEINYFKAGYSEGPERRLLRRM